MQLSFFSLPVIFSLFFMAFFCIRIPKALANNGSFYVKEMPADVEALSNSEFDEIKDKLFIKFEPAVKSRLNRAKALIALKEEGIGDKELESLSDMFDFAGKNLNEKLSYFLFIELEDDFMRVSLDQIKSWGMSLEKVSKLISENPQILKNVRKEKISNSVWRLSSDQHLAPHSFVFNLENLNFLNFKGDPVYFFPSAVDVFIVDSADKVGLEESLVYVENALANAPRVNSALAFKRGALGDFEHATGRELDLPGLTRFEALFFLEESEEVFGNIELLDSIVREKVESEQKVGPSEFEIRPIFLDHLPEYTTVSHVSLEANFWSILPDVDYVALYFRETSHDGKQKNSGVLASLSDLLTKFPERLECVSESPKLYVFKSDIGNSEALKNGYPAIYMGK